MKKTGEFREKWENLRENLRKTSNGDERIWEILRKKLENFDTNWKTSEKDGKFEEKLENFETKLEDLEKIQKSREK